MKIGGESWELRGQETAAVGHDDDVKGDAKLVRKLASCEAGRALSSKSLQRVVAVWFGARCKATTRRFPWIRKPLVLLPDPEVSSGEREFCLAALRPLYCRPV